MNRRTALQWVGRLLAVAVSAVVAIPGVRYILASVRRHPGGGPIVQRVIRLNDLKPNQPLQVTIIAKRQDAWTVYPAQTVGRAWLVRRTDADTAPEQTVVEAFSTTCPHLGCAIGFSTDSQQFLCPCHNAAFNMAGGTVAGPSPRGMDTLETRIVSVDDERWVELKYEQFSQGLAQKIATG